MSQSGHFRAHGRQEVDLAAALEPSVDPRSASDRPDGEKGGSREPVRIVNLSLAGACIETDDPVVPGASVTVEIVAPALWDPLVLQGRVVWSRGDRGLPHRAGLAFEPANASRTYALFELLSARDYDGA